MDPFDRIECIFGRISASFLLLCIFKVSRGFRILRGLREGLGLHAKVFKHMEIILVGSEITTKQPMDKNKVKSRVMCIISI